MNDPALLITLVLPMVLHIFILHTHTVGDYDPHPNYVVTVRQAFNTSTKLKVCSHIHVIPDKSMLTLCG